MLNNSSMNEETFKFEAPHKAAKKHCYTVHVHMTKNV